MWESRLARLRAEAEMTQEELATAAGVSVATYRRAETQVTGRPFITTRYRIARELAKALDRDPDALMGELWT